MYLCEKLGAIIVQKRGQKEQIIVVQKMQMV